MRVLITDGNERSALAVTRALGQYGIQVLVGAEGSRSLASVSRYCWQSFRYPSPYSQPGDYAQRLLDVIRRHQIDVVIPISDVALRIVAGHRSDIEQYAIVPIPSHDALDQLTDKFKLMRLAQTLGVPVPETIFVSNGYSQEIFDAIDSFPVIVKPARSATYIKGTWHKTGVHYVTNPSDLARLYADEEYLQQPSLIQKCVHGVGQGIFALMDRGKPLVFFAHRRLREKPPFGGVSVLSESIPLPEPMTSYALRLLEHVGWHGVAMVEFKVEEDSGQPLLMEVNGRFWGSLQLAIDSGVNFPVFLYNLATRSEAGLPSTDYRTGIRLRWLLGDLDHLLLYLFKDRADLHLPPGARSKLKKLLEFLKFYRRGMHYEVLRLADPLPFAYELKHFIGSLFQRAS